MQHATTTCTLATGTRPHGAPLGVSRRTFAALCTAATASLVACTLPALPAQALAAAAADAASPADGQPNLITAPQTPGSLPAVAAGPREVDLGDTLVIATPYYAVSLPKSLLGPAFTWEWDDTEVPSTTNATGDAPAQNWYPSGGFLTVDPGEGSPQFTVFNQAYGPIGMPLQRQTVLGEDLSYTEVGYNGARTFIATVPGEERWAKFVSAGEYAFTRKEAEGTRIYTPLYSVLVRPGWIDDNWCYTYNDGGAPVNGVRVYKRLDLYANEAEREAGITALSFVCLDEDADVHLFRDDPGAWSHHYRSAGVGTLEFSGREFYLQVLGWRTDAGAADWVDSWRAAEIWADNCVSTEITRASVAPEPVQTTADLWRVWTPWFSFDIPEPWRGRVKVRFDSESSVGVFANELPSTALACIEMGPADHQYPGGDMGAAHLWGIDNGHGQYVYLIGVNTHFNYSYDVENGRIPNASLELEREIVDLQTGGVYSLEDFTADNRDFAAEMAFGYYDQAVAPAINVAMDDDWAMLANLMRGGYGDLSVAEFHKRVHNELDQGAGLAWVRELGERKDVQEWAANYMPVSHFVAKTLPQFLDDAFELSGIASPVEPSFWPYEGQTTLNFELAYQIDPLATLVRDLEKIGWHQRALSNIPHLNGAFLNGHPKAPTGAQEMRAAIEEQIAWEMTRYEHPGITFDLRWTYAMADGTVLEGTYNC